MATYAVGDVQGCYTTLRHLLREIGFAPARDRLWFVGDLVNRGPNSLGVLRFVRDLQGVAVTVLGNHDLHLLTVAEGLADLNPGDTFRDVLRAPDHPELLHWLRHQPFIFEEQGYVLVHAGLLPHWTIPHAITLAKEAERQLQNATYRAFLEELVRAEAPGRSDCPPPLSQAVMVAYALVRLRVCSQSGRMNVTFTGPPSSAPPGFLPWFDVPHRRGSDYTVVFGHWAALGLLLRSDVIALDTGCVWGKQLSAIRLEDRRVYQVACSD